MSKIACNLKIIEFREFCLNIYLVHEPAWLVGTNLGNNAHGNFWKGIHL